MPKDYYNILGINRNASKEEIRKVYKDLAKKHHPDLHKGDKEKEEKFKEINEAYKVLYDEKARSNYDRFGSADEAKFSGFRQGDFGSEGFDFDIGDIFESFFGANQRESYGRERGRDLHLNMEVSLEDVFSGVKKKVEIEKFEECEKCDGTGAKSESDIIRCPDCNGRGTAKRTQRTPFGYFSTTMPCRKCKGTGKYVKDECKSCGGTGRIRKKKTIDIDIPPGISNGNQLRVSGEGEAGERSIPNGDLYITIRILPHKIFERKGDDLYMELPISFVSAAIGAEVEVPTIDGKATLRIPAGTQSDTIFVMRGKGIPHLHGFGQGSQNVKVIVLVPTKLTKRQKELLEEFEEESGEKGKSGLFHKIKHAFSE